MSTICLKCIGDEFLRAMLKDGSARRTCDYCEKARNGVDLERLTESVDGPIRQFCQQGEVIYGPDYFQEGDSLVDMLQAELEIDYEPAADIARQLIDSDPAWIPDGEQPFFEADQNYHRRVAPLFEYPFLWEEFCERLKHRSRFFDAECYESLAQILGESGSERASELPTLKVGPRTRVESVFRARRVDSESEAEGIARSPRLQLGAPPKHLATAGRLNPFGIPIFYGAVSGDTALSEVRPSVGGLVVVGAFKINRVLTVLDLSRLGVGFTGSIFAPDYADRAERLRFLEVFQALVARPIQPNHEPLEYLPTQAFAEYVQNVLGFDGILYASAQLGTIPESRESALYVRNLELSDAELSHYNLAVLRNLDNSSSKRKGRPLLSVSKSSIEIRTVSAISYEHELVTRPNTARRRKHQ